MKDRSAEGESGSSQAYSPGSMFCKSGTGSLAIGKTVAVAALAANALSNCDSEREKLQARYSNRSETRPLNEVREH